MPKFNGVIGLVGFLILAFLLFNDETSGGARDIFGSLATNSSNLIKALQGRK